MGISGVVEAAVRAVRRAVFFFQAEDGIRDYKVTGVQTCALPICAPRPAPAAPARARRRRETRNGQGEVSELQCYAQAAAGASGPAGLRSRGGRSSISHCSVKAVMPMTISAPQAEV